ncbi:MAG: 4Fe-4S dicluster domain-containing protein [Candidatus Methanomethylicaceae archaeon]|jgi:formate hydrogenlyase subunit 6/NADH:ubiquinone oxidoreductase subunit I
MSARIKILLEVLAKYSSPMTLTYPSNTAPNRRVSSVPDGLRGIPERSEEKCIGCKACANVCSGMATKIFDNEQDAKRLVQIFLFRCTFCQHCVDECPTEALTMSKKFEPFALTREDPANYVDTTLDLLRCQNCGKTFFPKKYVDKAYEWLMEDIHPAVKDVVSADFKKVEGYCPDCRRALAYKLDTHTKKHVWLEGK